MSQKQYRDSSIAPIDIEGTMERLNLSPDDARRLVKMVVDDLPQCRELIDRSRDDITQLRKHVHKLLGSTSYCQLPYVDSVARRIQSQYARNPQPSAELNAAIDELFAKIEEVQSFYAKLVFEESAELI